MYASLGSDCLHLHLRDPPASLTRRSVSRREASMRQMQEDERTYLTDVRASDAARFEEWQKDFDLSTRTDDISVVLSSNPKVRAIHSAAGTHTMGSLIMQRGVYASPVCACCSTRGVLQRRSLCAVPEKVSYAVFWKRYFFRLELLLENEQKRAAVLARTFCVCAFTVA